MEVLTEPQRDFVRALMTGAGLIDHENPLAYFTTYQVTPDEFHDVVMRLVPDASDRQAVVNEYIEAYNQYATRHMFWNMVGDLEPWDGED